MLGLRRPALQHLTFHRVHPSLPVPAPRAQVYDEVRAEFVRRGAYFLSEAEMDKARRRPPTPLCPAAALLLLSSSCRRRHRPGRAQEWNSCSGRRGWLGRHHLWV
jgi:hypothetical protein